jgi:hypothetical protein
MGRFAVHFAVGITHLEGCMTRLFARTLTLFILAMLGLVATASTQSMSVIKVNVPFEFTFGGRTFPADTYTLVQSRQHFLTLRDSRGRAVSQLFTEGIEPPRPADSTQMKFDASDGQHRLIEVWKEQNSSGRRLRQAKVQTSQAKRRSLEDGKTAEGGPAITA